MVRLRLVVFVLAALAPACKSAAAKQVDPGSPGAPGTNVRAALDSDGVSFFPMDSCPDGWVRYHEADGRVIVGMAAGGAVGGTVGEPLADQAPNTIEKAPPHEHAVDPPVVTTQNAAHGHTLTGKFAHNGEDGTALVQYAEKDVGSVPTDAHQHTHTVSASFPVQDTGVASVDATMPYVQLAACRPGEATRINIPSGGVAFFARDFCPTGWSEIGTAPGRVLIGLTDNGTLGAEVGPPLGDRAEREVDGVPAHLHSIGATPAAVETAGGHAHTLPRTSIHDLDGGNGDVLQFAAPGNSRELAIPTNSHNHAVDVAPFATTAGPDQPVTATMPYIQLAVCRRN